MESGPGTPTNMSKPVLAFHHRAFVASILIALAIIGLCGNALVIIAVVVAKKLRTITNILVINLAFVDFITCLCLAFISAGLLSQSGSYPLHETVCATVAGVHSTCMLCSLSSLVAIAFVRWFVITRSIRGYRILTRTKIGAVVVIIWIQSVAFMVVPPALGLGTLGYSEYFGICFLTDTNPLAYYLLTLQGALGALFLLLALIFYVLIWRHVLRHNKQFREKYAIDKDASSNPTQAHQSQNSSVSPNSRPAPMIKAINQKEVEITKNLFMVVCVFMICFLPNCLHFIISDFGVFTLYCYMILNMNSVVNPIIYGLKHPNFQEVFKNILRCRRLSLQHVST